jgi:copper homeostasis protein
MDFTLEVIAFNIESCILAQANGVSRIELCDNQADGGTTPSYGFIKAARAILSIELYPIIRPRGGDFLYSDEEFDIIKSDVLLCKELGCNGVVIGLLNADGTVDKERTKILTSLAYPMGVTFHRAFDRTKNMFDALEDIIECGCERILTSGQKPAAYDGKDNIKALIEKADHRIVIMPGSGINSKNIVEIAQYTGATEFHSSARNFIESKMQFSQSTMNEQLTSVNLNADEVISIIKALKSC